MKKMEKKLNDVRDFWNKRPCNVKHSSKNFGSIEYFNEVEKKRYTVEPHILEFANFTNCNNKKVLEIGCGIGTDSIMFSKNGAKLTTIDLSETSLEICKSRFDVLKFSANILYGNAEELSKYVNPEPYDLIYSFGVIHHTPNPDKVFDEIKKYCNKNTIIKVMLYSKYSWKGFEFFLKYGWKFKFNYKKTIKYFAEAQLGCPIAEVYTKKELYHLLKDFEIINIEKKHIFPYKINKYKKGILEKKLIFRIMPKPFYNFLSSKLGWHYLINMKLK